jgi:hypothetical protein
VIAVVAIFPSTYANPLSLATPVRFHWILDPAFPRKRLDADTELANLTVCQWFTPAS